MKTTTCRNLRGACDLEIQGETPEEMGQKSREHVMAMVAAGDQEHLAAMESMKQLSSEEQVKWYQDFVASFPSLPEA